MKNTSNAIVMALRAIFALTVIFACTSCYYTPTGGYAGGGYGGQPGYYRGQQFGGYGRPNYNFPGVRHSGATLTGGEVIHHTVTIDSKGRIKKDVTSQETINGGQAMADRMRQSGVDPFPFTIAPGNAMPSGVNNNRR